MQSLRSELQHIPEINHGILSFLSQVALKEAHTQATMPYFKPPFAVEKHHRYPNDLRSFLPLPTSHSPLIQLHGRSISADHLQTSGDGTKDAWMICPGWAGRQFLSSIALWWQKMKPPPFPSHLNQRFFPP